MKLLSNRDQDRVHLRDLIEVGLVGRDLLGQLSAALAERLEALLSEAGRKDTLWWQLRTLGWQLHCRPNDDR